MKIITAEAPCAEVFETENYVTLKYQGASLQMPALPRPDNFSEVVYWSGSAFQFKPAERPVIAAVLACHAGEMQLTLFPLEAQLSSTQFFQE